MNTNKAPSTLFAFGINHKTAPVEVREKLFLNDGEVRQFLRLVKSKLPECLVLSTCNRTEIYGVTESPEFEISDFKNLLIDFKVARGDVRDEHFFELMSCSASQQLFSVATSVDSRVVGDLQILKQLRNSYSLAREAGTAGKIINQLLQRAFKIGKQTFTETSIHEGAISASLAAVEMALEIFGSLRDRNALVLGAGDTARLTAEALINKRVRKLIVSNRTRSHASELLGSLEPGQTETAIVDFDAFHDSFRDVDIVISSTGAQTPIIGPNDVKTLTRKILLIDLAVPRDIDPDCGELPGVTVVDIDGLQAQVRRHISVRKAEARHAEGIVEEEIQAFAGWLGTLEVMPTVTALRAHADDIVTQVLAENEGRWDSLSERDRKRVEALARAVAKRLLHEPTARVKGLEASRRHARLQLLRDLFGLDEPAPEAAEQPAEVRKLRRR